MKVKCTILISPCCCTFENAVTRLKDVTTHFSHKLLFQCPNQSRKKIRNEILTLLYSSLWCWCYNSCKYAMELNPEIMCWSHCWKNEWTSLLITGITKPYTHLHPAPSTFTQLISTSTQLHPTSPSSFQPPPSSIHLDPDHFSLHPALCNTLHCKNQNVARNWAISPNLGRKFQSCLFRLKFGTHGILELLIPNPDLEFWNSDPKSFFGQISVEKVKVVYFAWKLTHMVSWRSRFCIQLRFSKFRS